MTVQTVLHRYMAMCIQWSNIRVWSINESNIETVNLI